MCLIHLAYSRGDVRDNMGNQIKGHDVLFYNLVESAPSGSFMIAHIGDTQNVVADYESLFANMCSAIAGQQFTLDLQVVLCPGDIVDTSNDASWAKVEAGIDLLDDKNIPYLFMPGSHDYDTVAN